MSALPSKANIHSEMYHATAGCMIDGVWALAYFASVAAFSINAVTSGACERKIAWLPGSSMTCDCALRHESLEVRIDHSVLHGNYSDAPKPVARFMAISQVPVSGDA